MVTLILSILFWAKKDNKTLGIAAIAMGVIGSLISCIMYGPVGLVDVAVLVVNIIVFYINHIKKNGDDDNELY